MDLTGSACFMNGNTHALHEIIYNLCDNAIKYNRLGGHVSINISDNVIKIRDNGIGIPEKDQPRVFERFYHVDKSHSKETGGTGLGLSIVKHAVLLHGGEILMNSKYGEGTEIKVIL